MKVQMSVNFSFFNVHFQTVDITPDMLKLCRVIRVKVPFLVLVYVFNFNLFEFLATILEKGLFALLTGIGKKTSVKVTVYL